MRRAFLMAILVVTSLAAALLAAVNLAFNEKAFKPDLDRSLRIAHKVLTLLTVLIVLVPCAPAILAFVLDIRWATRNQEWLDEPLRL